MEKLILAFEHPDNNEQEDNTETIVFGIDDPEEDDLK